MVTGSQMLAAILLAILFGFTLSYTKMKYFPEQPRWPMYAICGLFGWFAIDIVRALGF